ncbi:MAG: 50S ribosomal protein L1 [Bifidobacterium pseudocatenulatum]
MVRGSVNLPNGTGKTARSSCSPVAEATRLSRLAPTSSVRRSRAEGCRRLPDFDSVVATRTVGKVGPPRPRARSRGLMPNPKTGTVTMDVTKAIKDIKGGKVDFRVDKNGNLSFLIGKLSFTEQALDENFKAVADEIKRLKPSTVKGRYVTKATITSTMNPGVPVDPTVIA